MIDVHSMLWSQYNEGACKDLSMDYFPLPSGVFVLRGEEGSQCSSFSQIDFGYIFITELGWL